MQKYGLEKFVFEVLAEVEPDKLKKAEQEFIETFKPTYNNINAKGWDVERYKEYQKDYNEKHKEEILEQKKQYYESHKEQKKQYNNQLCFFNGETLTLCALSTRFRRRGIPHPTLEAKKYLIKN